MNSEQEMTFSKFLVGIAMVLTTTFFIWLGANMSELSTNMAVIKEQVSRLSIDSNRNYEETKLHTKSMNKLENEIMGIELRLNKIEDNN